VAVQSDRRESGSFRRVVAGGLAAASLLVLAACGDDQYLPRNSRHWVALSPEIQSKMSEIGVSRHSPTLIRAFKKEGELELWKADSQGEYKLLKTYPICRWSGQLGPKKNEGDRQVPEGFYSITPQSMNPNSSFYLSFNVGYPNAFDRSLGRDGSLIMVHGSCSSRGCFAMTDQQIAEIYAVTRESFSGGQQAIQMQSFPFRFTPQNLARYRADDNLPFWKNLKEGSDHFEVTKREPKVAACGRKYVFNATPANGSFDAKSACPPVQQDATLVAQVEQKARNDEQQVASLIPSTKAIKRIYADGDQHPTFRNTQFAYSPHDGVTRPVAASPASRIAEVSRPDELAAGPVEVPAEAARGLNRQQLIAKAEAVRAQQIAAHSAETVTASTAGTGATTPAARTPAAAPGRTPQPTTATANAPQSAPPTPNATALAATPAAPTQEQPAFYQRWLGQLGGLTANASDVEQAPQAVEAPTPPKAPRR
jgi:murein L,D-transpeptidase YafK